MVTALLRVEFCEKTPGLHKSIARRAHLAAISVLLAFSALTSVSGLAGTSEVTIRDVVYTPTGNAFSGVVTLLPRGFPKSENPPKLLVPVEDGMLTVKLHPTGSESNTYYLVTYSSLDHKPEWSEEWKIPIAVSPLRLNEVRRKPATLQRTEPSASSNRVLPSPPQQDSRIRASAERSAVRSAYVAPPTVQSVFGESPNGAIDGTNTTFTLQNSPVSTSSVAVYRNGVRQRLGTDYSMSGNMITFLRGSIPGPGDTLLADYSTVSVPAINSGTFTVGGSATSFYPVIFSSQVAATTAYAASNTLVLFRDNVHENGYWNGTFSLTLVFHPSNWGHWSINEIEQIFYRTGSGGIAAGGTGNYQDPVGDMTDGSYMGGGSDLVLWLRGGATYHWRSPDITANWTLVNGNPTGGSITDSSGTVRGPISRQSSLILNGKNNISTVGYGVYANGITLGPSGMSTTSIGTSVRRTTTNDTVSPADHTIVANAGSGGLLETLPALPSNGQELYFVNAGSNAITVAGNGNVIWSAGNSFSTIALPPNATTIMQWDGSAGTGMWRVIK